jgi:hypothetical protein
VIVMRNVLRKVRQGVDRLASQGPDPAVTDATPLGWRIAAAAFVERYPLIVPEPHPFEALYREGRFKWQQSVARPIPEEFFISEREAVTGGMFFLPIPDVSHLLFPHECRRYRSRGH